MSGSVWGDEWDDVVDVVVVGSGVAGYAAAVAAGLDGASVVVLEKAPLVGGTTAKSGGVLWICDNAVMRAAGIVDERGAALRYLARTAYPLLYDVSSPTLGLPPDIQRLLETFYDRGAPALDEMIEAGILDVEALEYPDYYADLDEDAAPWGRVVQPAPPPGWRRGIDPSGGQLLVDRLASGAQRLGATTLTDHRAVHVVRDDSGRVVGVEARTGTRTKLVGARRGTVFATGGFLHNRRLTLEYLRGPVFGGAGAEGSTGDFVTIGLEVGAQLGNMSHAWWDQVVVELAARVPQTIRDVYSPYGDSMIMVNRYGRRVVDEKAPYNERGQVHFHWDPGRREYPNLVLFMLFDDDVAQNPERSRFRFPVPEPGEPLPPYVLCAPTWPELTEQIDAALARLASFISGVRLDPAFTSNLTTTIARWDEMAVNGIDEDFVRGEALIERTWAQQPRHGAASASMHPFSPTGPYYCVIVGPGALDTKGGPVIDEHARVLDASGVPIPGLYGAGNCIASPAGQSYWGPGATIGLAFTFGAVAGHHAAAHH